MVSFGEGVFMKTSFAVVAVVAFGLAGNEAAKGSGNTSSNSGGAAPHHGSAPAPATTTAVAPRFNGGVSQARLNHANNCHHHHGSNWWRNRCAAIIFFDWGWWGWYDGWWYPAWGYDPYSNYEYNEPIYGYDGLSPDQIVASVQAQLQQLGYYTYAIDGRMGPLTRTAIARYQRDRLLPITSGIDPATLGSLGIIR